MFWLIVITVIATIAYYIHLQKKQGEIEGAEEGSEASETEGEKQGEIRRTKFDSKWRTVNTSGTLIEGAEGKRDAVEALIKRNLTEIAVPNISVGHRLVSLTGVSSMFAGERKLLVIQNTKIQGYYLFVNIYDYGKQLSVSWYLMLRENWLSRLLAMAEKNPAIFILLLPIVFFAKILYTPSRTTIPELMNMFDVEELSAYTTTVHHAVQEAVHEVSKDLNLNSAKTGWQTRGFLSIA